MLDKRFDRPTVALWATTIGWLGAAVIALLSLLPSAQRPHSGAPGQIEHVIAYLLTSVALFYGHSERNIAVRFLVFCCFAAVLETLQIFVPGRIPQLSDLAASVTGVAVGLLAAVVIKASWAPGEAAARAKPSDPKAAAIALSETKANKPGRNPQSLDRLINWSYERGLTTLLVDLPWPVLTVLCYHRVADVASHSFQGFKTNVSATPEAFERQIEYLVEHFSPISADHLTCWLDCGDTLPRRPVLVTFDDGYRDNGEAAWPVMRRKGVPGIVFLATDHIGTGRPFLFLWDFAAYCFQATRCDSADVPLLGPTSLATAAERDQSVESWVLASKALPYVRRWPTAHALAAALDAFPPQDAFADLYLSWSDVQRLGSEGLDFGGHTASHPILARTPMAEARKEIEDSRERIGSVLGRPPCAFAYPNGSALDFRAEHEQAVRDAGYKFAFSMEPGPMSLLGARRQRMAIRRVYVGLRDDMPRFSAKLAGGSRLRRNFS